MKPYKYKAQDKVIAPIAHEVFGDVDYHKDEQLKIVRIVDRRRKYSLMRNKYQGNQYLVHDADDNEYHIVSEDEIWEGEEIG